MAIIASTADTALGTIQVSCLPLTSKLTFSIFLMLTVSWLLAMEEVGLTTTLIIIGIPLLIPPSMPPALLVTVIILPSFYGIGTGLPVLVFAVLLAFSTKSVGVLFNALTVFEYWARRLTGVIFIVVGLYLSLKYIFNII